jgi:hypothetical protein
MVKTYKKKKKKPEQLLLFTKRIINMRLEQAYFTSETRAYNSREQRLAKYYTLQMIRPRHPAASRNIHVVNRNAAVQPITSHYTNGHNQCDEAK